MLPYGKAENVRSLQRPIGGIMQSSKSESICKGCGPEDSTSNCSQTAGVADLEKRLKEMTFVSRFMAATSASLVPYDICAIAARHLYDFAPYNSIVFSLAPEFGVKPVVFTPGKGEDGARLVSKESLSPVRFREFRIDERFKGIIFKSSDGGSKGVDMVLPDKMGRIRVIFDSLNRKEFSPALFSEVAGHFSGTLKNALAHEKVKELATKDGLTGLFNRRVFDELLSVEMKRKDLMPISLLLIDLDDFKKINDTFGHPAGDEVLATVGKIFRDGCRGADLVARYGGEEFAVMLPSTSSSVAFEIAQRLRARIAGTVFVFDGRPITLTASIGVAHTSSGRSDAIAQLVSRADQALYRAKKNGKNMTYVYTSKSMEISQRQAGRGAGVAWLRSA